MNKQSVYEKYTQDDFLRAIVRLDVAFQSLKIFIVPSGEMNQRHLAKRIDDIQAALDSVEAHRMGIE